MYCNQCEQTSKGIACSSIGVCGKKPEVSALQDLVLYAVKGLALYAQEADKLRMLEKDVARLTVEAIFSTLTNVNFDPEALQLYVYKCVARREDLRTKLSSSGHEVKISDPAAEFIPSSNLEQLIQQAEEIGFLVGKKLEGDIRSLQELVLYGIKGVAAYAHHAALLGREDERVYAYIHETMAKIGRTDMDLNEWLQIAMQCGEINLRAMELLDAGNTSAFGHPVPQQVPLGHRTGKCILISGHDLQDLKALLEATEGRGIDIYTHGEMLPAHGYPELNKHRHLYGNFGTAWQNQKKEFVNFPGAILMTTNCIQEPQDSYQGNIFTTGPVGWPGVKHLNHGDYSALIEKALGMPGFTSDENQGSVMVGFARNTIMSVADKIVAAVKSGDLKHIFLVGGCDGAKSARSYFADFVEKTPADSFVLTLGCGKYRFFDKQLGDIGGIPRLLDIGQCNDAYSAIQVAVALSQVFECGVNDLPLSLVISWYEQKAVSILLTLLYLGIKNIRLGPSLPAFVSPNVLKILVENFDIKPISTVDEDLAAILG